VAGNAEWRRVVKKVVTVVQGPDAGRHRTRLGVERGRQDPVKGLTVAMTGNKPSVVLVSRDAVRRKMRLAVLALGTVLTFAAVGMVPTRAATESRAPVVRLSAAREFTGQVEKIDRVTNRVTVRHGDSLTTIQVQGETEHVDAMGGPVDPLNLQEGDWVQVLGQVREDGSLLGRRFKVFGSTPPGSRPDPALVRIEGTVKRPTYNLTRKVVVNGKDRSFTLVVPKDGQVIDIEPVSLHDLVKDDRIVAYGTWETPKRFVARRVLVNNDDGPLTTARSR
jgi:Cu/Ag efflux protein CusF